jgi:hypothetical protein
VTTLGKRFRVRRRWLMLLVVVAVVALFLFAVTIGCSATTGFGGTSCWWEGVPWGIRGFIRALWAGVTRQPATQDLFPF